MMCSAYFGELNPVENTDGTDKELSPYDILKEPVKLERKGWDLLNHGSKYFGEKKQLDWGSFIWESEPEAVMLFLNDFKSTLPWLEESEDDIIESVRQYVAKRNNTQYGVVFIEEI